MRGGDVSLRPAGLLPETDHKADEKPVGEGGTPVEMVQIERVSVMRVNGGSGGKGVGEDEERPAVVGHLKAE